jgi:hypothetical protein
MAEPARSPIEPLEEELPLDPDAVDRAYRYHRAQRRARIERSRRRRHATLRFVVVFVVLLALAITLAITIWREIGRLFGI